MTIPAAAAAPALRWWLHPFAVLRAKLSRVRLPRWVPPALIWSAVTVAAAVALVVVVLGVDAVLWLSALPWWALLLAYAGPTGAALRAARSARSGWAISLHTAHTYIRWCRSLSDAKD